MIEARLSIPRNAFSPREVARAGDVWRLFQELAVAGSTEAGWPPARYRAEGVSFVMRSMTVVHHREAVYGDAIVGRTWPSKIQRALFFRREGRTSTAAGPLASTTQEWVHVRAPLELAPASAEMLAAFAVEAHDGAIELPSFRPHERAIERSELAIDCWHTWMDPLAHVNHPAYVDFADEALARIAADRGLDPQAIVPVAEHARFSRGLVAGERALVQTREIGRTDDAAVFEHRVIAGEREAARVVTMRRMFGEEGRCSLLATA